MEFEYRDASERKATVTLFYNKKFARRKAGATKWDGSYSATFNPDYSIRIIANAERTQRLHWLHFDAKYRLDFEIWKAEIEGKVESNEQGQEPENSADEEVEIREIYERNDLFKMHTYRDALLGSRGSYILFPGSKNDEDVFIRYPGVEYPNNGPNIPSVGAFQARPTKSAEQGLFLKRFIQGFLDLILSSEKYQEESGLF